MITIYFFTRDVDDPFSNLVHFYLWAFRPDMKHLFTHMAIQVGDYIFDYNTSGVCHVSVEDFKRSDDYSRIGFIIDIPTNLDVELKILDRIKDFITKHHGLRLHHFFPWSHAPLCSDFVTYCIGVDKPYLRKAPGDLITQLLMVKAGVQYYASKVFET